MSRYEHSPWMTVPDAADYAGMHPDTLRHALQDGVLTGYQRTAPKGRWRIHNDDLDAWLRGERPGRPALRIA